MSGLPRFSHPAVQCVVELRVTDADGAGRIGSGYLVDRGWVLTAAHVVREMTSVRAWVNSQVQLLPQDETRVDLSGVQYDADWALIPVPEHEPPVGFRAAEFATVDRTSVVPISVIALGMPWFKLREPRHEAQVNRGSVREIAVVGGEILPMGNTRTGTFAMTVVGAPQTLATHKDRKRSVWEGMSGAAVWAGDRIVGVVDRHHATEGAGSLTLQPRPAGNQLGAVLSGLSQSVPIASPTKMIAANYQRVARRLSPAILSGRIEEVAEFNEFASGPDRWRWYTANAFAGKTALLAWWTANNQLHDVVAVSCFLRRSAGLNTARDVIGTLLTQLGAIAGLPEGELRQPQLQSADASALSRLDELLEAAARRCHRLVVLIDGLDEYEPVGQIPVAEWLPGSQTLPLPPNAALLVTSRAGAPTGIPDDHPLREHRTSLSSSLTAGRLQRRAEDEINHALQDPSRLDARIVGFLAAADGPLTHDDLTSLIRARNPGVYASDVQLVWKRRLARTLTPTARGDGYEFSHDALREHARTTFAGDLPVYRQDLHDWAHDHATRGWPADTPPYLLTGYAGMLAAERDPARLVAVAIDPARQTRLRTATGGDAIALADLRAAAQLLTSDPRYPDKPAALPGICVNEEVDLVALAKVVWYQERLRDRNTATPVRLPAVWAELGHHTRAENLAGAITSGPDRVEALAMVAVAQTRAGLVREARANLLLAGQATAPLIGRSQNLRAWVALVTAQVEAGQIDDARRIATLLADDDRSEILAALAEALARMGEIRQAVEVGREVHRLAYGSDRIFWSQMHDLARIATALAQTGRPAEGEWFADRIGFAEIRAKALATVATAFAEAGRFADAERIAATIDDPACRVLTQVRAATLLARTGLTSRARTITDEAERVAGLLGSRDRERALTALIETRAAVDQRAAVAALCDQVEDGIARLSNPHAKAEMLYPLADELAKVGEISEAARVAAAITVPLWRARAFLSVCRALSEQGQVERAKVMAGDVARLGSEVAHEAALWDRDALIEIVTTLTKAGHHAESEQVLADVTPPEFSAEVRTERAMALIEAGEHQQATALAERIAQSAAAATNTYWRTRNMIRLADSLAMAGEVTQARCLAEHIERAVGTISDPDELSVLNCAFAILFARIGRYRDAERVADGISEPTERLEALIELAVSLGRGGEAKRFGRVKRRIEQLGSSVEDSRLSATAVLGFATLAAEKGQYAQAEQTVTEIDDPVWRSTVVAGLAPVLLAAGESVRAATMMKAVAPAISVDGGTYLRDQARVAVVKMLAKAGQYADAEQVAGTVESDELRAGSWVSIAASLIEVGDRELAMELLEKTDRARLEPDLYAESLADLAAALVRSDRRADAEAIPSMLRTPAGHCQVLAAMVVAYSELGEPAEADRLAEQVERSLADIDDVDDRTDQMVALVPMLARTSAQPTARRLVAAIWTVKDWDVPLETLVCLDPAPLLALARLELADYQP
ncbi:trypsin-like peptidase domain-containing protein [Kribbella sp. NPDC056861]|uniref:trypsin-like peptidase domain-containing protein n=1 Tax=Kribbella sp. NPDC056861 TaxID=3154857 RepID=UPI003429D9D6